MVTLIAILMETDLVQAILRAFLPDSGVTREDIVLASEPVLEDGVEFYDWSLREGAPTLFYPDSIITDAETMASEEIRRPARAGYIVITLEGHKAIVALDATAHMRSETLGMLHEFYDDQF